MYEGRSVFAQIMDRIPWRTFQKIIDKYHGDHHVTNLKTTILFRVLAFAQLARKVSLRDTFFTLNMMKSKHEGKLVGLIIIKKIMWMTQTLITRRWSIGIRIN